MSLLSHPRVAYWVRDPLWGALYHAIFHAFRLLPCSTASDLGARLGQLEGSMRFAPLAPRIAHCLGLIRPDLPQERRAPLIREMWRNIGRVHGEMAVLDRLWDAAAITVVNAQLLRDVQRAGRPIVFVFAHLGNWELLAAAAQRYGIVLNVVFENLRNRFESRLAARARRMLGYRLLAPTRRGVQELYAALQRSEAVALALDEFKNGNVLAPQFGRPLPDIANLRYALRLARRFDAAIVPCYSVRTGPLAFTLTFQQELMNPDAAQLNALCEGWIRAHPEQWYMLWRLLPEGLAAGKE